MIDPAALDDAQARFDFLRAVPGLALVASTNGGEYHGPCPVCGGRDRFVCWPHPREGRPRAFCRQCHPDPMSALDFLRWRDGLSFLDACARLDVRGVRALPRPAKPPKARAHPTPTLVDTTDFEDASGVVVLRKERYEPGWPDRDGAPRDKSFKLYHPDGAGWAPGKGTAEPRAMFRLAACLAAPPGSTIYFTEGELKAKALLNGGRLATCRWEGGTAWRAGYRAPFVDQHAVILEDADQTGADLTAKLLPDVLAVARSVRVVCFPDLGDGADLIDWLAAGHTLDELDALVAATAPVDSTPAPSEVPDPPAAPRFQVLDDAAIDALPPPTWLIDQVLIAGAVNVLYGPGGAGKSVLAIDAACTLAAGLPTWYGHPTAPGPVIYIGAEAPEEVAQRRRAWKADRGIPTLPNFFLVPERVPLLDPEAVPALIDSLPAQAARPALFVVDTLSRTMRGGDENSGQDMGRVFEAAELLRDRTGATILIIHHSGKDTSRGARGFSGLTFDARQTLGMSREESVVTLAIEKHNNSPDAPDLRFVLRSVPDPATPDATTVILGEATPEDLADTALGAHARQILEALCGPESLYEESGATPAELKESLGWHGQAVYRALRPLRAREYIQDVGNTATGAHRYKATWKGFAAIGVLPPPKRRPVTAFDSVPAPGFDTPVGGFDTALTEVLADPLTLTDPLRQAPFDTFDTPLTAFDIPLTSSAGGFDTFDSSSIELSNGQTLSEATDADPLPDPSVIAPVWGTPPDTASPRPAHVCFRGHSAVQWDDATDRWRCYTCWERYQE